jgi:hypothetical protein
MGEKYLEGFDIEITSNNFNSNFFAEYWIEIAGNKIFYFTYEIYWV